MCGIDGLLSREIIDHNTVKGMTHCMVHRGPHSDGFFNDDKISLGMRRLKVIDLETGNQPIYNENKTVVVVYNGEIYNFHSLKNELVKKGHDFKTKTDTEVLVHGYEEWGIDELISRLNGMFAFCIYDKEKKKVILARDRLGEKPLYYFYDGRDFVFGSELQALLESGKIPIEISKVGLYYYLALNYVPGDMCIIKDVKKLLPGHYLYLDMDEFDFKLVKYWDLEERNYEHKTYQEYVKTVRKLVEDSIRMRLFSDVPLGVFLSGGIDSSIITAVMKKFNEDVKTFSVGFNNPEFDESNFSKMIAKEYGTDHHHFILEPEKISDLLPKIIRYMDEPTGDQALLPTFWLSYEAKKYVTVALGGEGGDEIFGGYSYYPANNSNETNFQGSPNLPSMFFKSEYETQSGFPLLSDHTMRSKLISDFNMNNLNHEQKKYQWLEKLEDAENKIQNKLRKCQYLDIKSWLPEDLLMKFDKMSMAHSLEGRAPYLDYRLVEFVFNLPSEYKIKGNIHKFILRDAFREELPKKIFERKKQGFNLPMSEWLKTHLKDSLKKITTYTMDDGINNDYLETLIDEHLSGKEDRGRLLYSILVYKLWAKNLFERFLN